MAGSQPVATPIQANARWQSPVAWACMCSSFHQAHSPCIHMATPPVSSQMCLPSMPLTLPKLIWSLGMCTRARVREWLFFTYSWELQHRS
jgi:hypothetical protein